MARLVVVGRGSAGQEEQQGEKQEQKQGEKQEQKQEQEQKQKQEQQQEQQQEHDQEQVQEQGQEQVQETSTRGQALSRLHVVICGSASTRKQTRPTSHV